MEPVKIDYSRLLSIKLILLTSTLSVLILLTAVYLHPANQGWWSSPQFSWSNLFRFIFLDQILIECITVFIIMVLIKFYGEKLNLTLVKADGRGIAKYQLYFLPIPFLAFFLFNPFTQTIRFFYHYFPDPDWAVYWEEYFYSPSLYLTYLPLSFLQVYGVLNYNLLTQMNRKRRQEPVRSFIEVKTSLGKRLIDKKEIIYCEKRKRKYMVYSGSGSFTVPFTISKLENMLPSDEFVRVNRAVIVKIDAIRSYSFWENDKYVVRIEGDHEFVMSRKRLNRIRDRLERLETQKT